MANQKTSWWFLFLAPIVGLIGLLAWMADRGYDGHCGFLDVGWLCGRMAHLLSALASPLSIALLLVYSAGWLAILVVARMILGVIQRRR